MRTITYKDWQLKRGLYLKKRATAETIRGGSSKPRDSKERELLLRLDRVRLNSWYKSGRLVKIGPRQYKLDTSK